MLPAGLSEHSISQLKKIKKGRGIDAFCKKARIDLRTFHNLIRTGNSRPDVLKRVETALQDHGKNITAEAVKTAVTVGYTITHDSLMHNTRVPVLAEARQVAVYFMYNLAKLNKPQIANVLGYADRTGPIVALKTVDNLLQTDPEFKERVERIRGKLLAAC